MATWTPSHPGQLLAAGTVPHHVPVGMLLLVLSDAGCCPNLQRSCGHAASGAGRALMRVGLRPREAQFGLVRASQHPGWQTEGERQGGCGCRWWERAVVLHALPGVRLAAAGAGHHAKCGAKSLRGLRWAALVCWQLTRISSLDKVGLQSL